MRMCSGKKYLFMLCLAVLAIGPGAMVSFSPQDHLLFNAYFEVYARNRPQGTRMVLRYVHHFQ